MSTEQRPFKVFLCHAPSDEGAVRKLYLRLRKDGVDAWLGSEKLLGGQDRDLEIRRTVRRSDAVIVCLSRRFNQAGPQQREARLALDTALEQPPGEIFIIPARLEDCEIPDSLRNLQAVDLFRERGYERLRRALKADAEHRNVALSETSHEHPEEEEPALTENTAEENAEPEGAERPAQEEIEAGSAEDSGGGKRGTRRRKYSRGMNTAIVVALIGLVGTLGAALISSRGDKAVPAPTWTPTSTVTFTSTVTETPPPTATNTPTPTFTPVPATDTPTPTMTVISPVPLGEDWMKGCISILWSPYPSSVTATERGDGCWKEPLHVFSAENGDLDFLAQRKNAPVEVYGLFARLPESGTVTFKVRLRDLSKVDLWMGIFAEADIRSEGLLMIVPAGDVKKRVFVQKDIPSYDTLASTKLLEQGNGWTISFRWTANSARGMLIPSVFQTNAASIPSSEKWLFLGYKGLSGSYRVDGTFLSLELK